MGITTMKRHPNSRFCIVPMITCSLPLFTLGTLLSEAKCPEARAFMFPSWVHILSGGRRIWESCCLAPYLSDVSNI